MVTAPKQAPTRAAMSMLDQLNQMELRLDGILVNRCMVGSISAEMSGIEAEKIECRPIRNLRTRSLSEKTASDELRLRATKLFPRCKFLQLEEMSGSMDSLEAITQLASALG
jgi:hypothetical protein